MMTKKKLYDFYGMVMVQEIAELNSKRKVAEIMNSSADTVTKYISNLEHSLGVKLITKSTKGCRLTSRGEILVQHMNDIRDIFEKIYRLHPKISECKGDVFVGVEVAAAGLSVGKIEEFYRHYPEVRIVSMVAENAVNCWQAEVDIAITLYSEIIGKNFLSVLKKDIACGLFASPEYLARYGVPSDKEDLINNHRLVIRSDCNSYHKEWREIVRRSAKICYVSNSAYALCECVKKGLGIGLLPIGFEEEGLVRLKLSDFSDCLEICLTVNNHTAKQPRVQAAVEHYRNVFNQM